MSGSTWRERLSTTVGVFTGGKRSTKYTFTHAQLEKNGIISESNVPDNRRPNIYFVITSPAPRAFIIGLYYKGREKPILEMDITMDHLLENQKNNRQLLDLEYVLLNVPKVMRLLQKIFAIPAVSPSVTNEDTTLPKILMHETLLLFLRDACNINVPRFSRSRSEVTQIQKTLDGYLLSMASNNVVSAIVESLESRKKLLELSSKLGLTNDPKLREALRADDERIATLLVSIFTSKDDEEAVLNLENDSAQHFLDVVQNALDKGFLLADEDSRMARRIIRKLSESSDKLPSQLFITGVSGREEHPTFGGGYGDIYRASYNKKPVALKRMRYFLRGADLRLIHFKFCREALVWKDLHHPHILPFLGIDRDSFPSTLCMVSPWMEHGTIVNYLKVHGHENVDRLLYQIAQGLQYLHSRNIIHGDLRGANILINEDWNAYLADFGLSKISDATSSMTTNRGGSLYWMAPELIDPDRFGCQFTRTPATDVYAFGCVCFELYTGRPPFANLSEPAAMLKTINGDRPERPPAMPAQLWQHVTTYWAQSPTDRPITQFVVESMSWVPRSAANGVTVRYTFIPSLPDELEVSAGEILWMLSKYEDGWALCENKSGVQGVVPLECLGLKVPASTVQAETQDSPR